jgi:hypothetical protein
MSIGAPDSELARSGGAVPGLASRAWMLVVFVSVLLLHASHYLYYFVDDEGISLVYAQRLLRGDGLTYASFEGRVEGYSNFLHVLCGAAWLGIARALGWDRISVFFIGKALSLLWGVAALSMLWLTLRRERSITTAGLAGALGFTALAPTVAVWSCSSLEMSLVLLLVACLCGALLDDTGRFDAVAAALCVLLLLLRIDGLVYVTAIIVPWLLFSRPSRRRQLFVRLALPVAMSALVYHTARFWYFRDLLTPPIYSKVLPRLMGPDNIAVKGSAASYGLAFLGMYGVAPAAAGVASLIVACRHHLRALLLLLGATLLMAYASTVGDWMFGFRFFLPALPPIALAMAVPLSTMSHRRAAGVLTGVLLAWFGLTAWTEARTYDALPHRESWLRSPSLRVERYFGPYHALLERLRGRVAPGDRIAYNQCGFIPFILDVENVDDLGICSRFVAKLPTTDVIFTDVGRYSPLTDARALRAANAYVLYRDPALLIVPLKDLTAANGSRVPGRLLRRHYRLREVIPGAVAVYERSASTDAFREGPGVFLDNLAHPARFLDAAIDNHPVAPAAYLHQLALFAGEASSFPSHGTTTVQLTFSDEDLPVFEVDIARIRASQPSTLRLALLSHDGATVFRLARQLPARSGLPVSVSFREPVRASRLSMVLEHSGGMVRVSDVRVQGQTPELAAYVRQLTFTRGTPDGDRNGR